MLVRLSVDGPRKLHDAYRVDKGGKVHSTMSCAGGSVRLSRRVPEESIPQTADGEPGLNYLCAGYIAFFKHIDRPMANLLRQGWYADEAMAMLAH